MPQGYRPTFAQVYNTPERESRVFIVATAT